MKKICSKCKIEKDITEFSKDKAKKDGLRSHCKECMKAYREANKEKMKAYREINKDKRKEYDKKYRETNKDKRKGYDKKYRETNKDKRKGYYEANKDKSKIYYKANKDKIKAYREANKEKIKEYLKVYCQTERGKEVQRRKNHKRRAKIRQVADLGTYTTTEWKECLKFFNYCDAYTGEPLGEDITIDHITPISKGGTNNINNLVPCKGSINKSKNASLLDEWYPKQSFYSKERHNKIKEWMKKKAQITLFEAI